MLPVALGLVSRVGDLYSVLPEKIHVKMGETIDRCYIQLYHMKGCPKAARINYLSSNTKTKFPFSGLGRQLCS